MPTNAAEARAKPCEPFLSICVTPMRCLSKGIWRQGQGRPLRDQQAVLLKQAFLSISHVSSPHTRPPWRRPGSCPFGDSLSICSRALSQGDIKAKPWQFSQRGASASLKSAILSTSCMSSPHIGPVRRRLVSCPFRVSFTICALTHRLKRMSEQGHGHPARE